MAGGVAQTSFNRLTMDKHPASPGRTQRSGICPRIQPPACGAEGTATRRYAMKSFTVLGALAGILILATPASQAQQLHNTSWQSQIRTGDMPELLGNLRELTD